MLNNLVILAWYVIGFCSLLAAGDFIACAVMNWQDKKLFSLQYGRAGVGHVLKPRNK
jgi:hypothetical protein